MERSMPICRFKSFSTFIAACFAVLLCVGYAFADAPTPLLKKGESVKWWLVFKFNATSFPDCAGNAERKCIFGGTVQNYARFSQQYVYASEKDPKLQINNNKVCVGDTVEDPVGATFDQVFNGDYFYVIWNDQFYLDPKLQCRGNSCPAPWAHSKGMIAWDRTGAGFVMQVTTPNWPGAGKPDLTRVRGNTLGCLTQIKSSKVVPQNNVLYSQHFFALQLSKDDLQVVLKALKNAAIVTDPDNEQIVRNGGPPEIVELVKELGETTGEKTFTKDRLSSGVTLISKPANLSVPPWQMVSAALGGASLRVASWWQRNRIPTTTPSTEIDCWDESVLGKTSKLGSVEIAKTGQWDKQELGLKGGQNHAKIGVSTRDTVPLSIFGDMNQEGALEPIKGKCAISQNARGGLFFVVEDATLFKNVKLLLRGETASTNLEDDDNAGGDDD